MNSYYLSRAREWFALAEHETPATPQHKRFMELSWWYCFCAVGAPV